MGDKQKQIKRQDDWVKENTLRINFKLSHKSDADIIEALADAPAKSTELKRLIRVGIQAEKAKGDSL